MEVEKKVTLTFIIFSFIGLTVADFYKAWVITVLWAWFVEPYFWLPELSFLNALGFTFLLAVIRTKPEYKNQPHIDAAATIKTNLLISTACLAFGYLTFLCM